MRSVKTLNPKRTTDFESSSSDPSPTMGNCLKPLKKQLPSISPKPLIVPPMFSVELENENLRVFSSKEVKKATKKFREKKFVKCEDGCVRSFYKGYINETTFAPSRTGTGLAVSVMECDHSRSLQQWMAIVKSLGQISHPNLVKLFGYCCEDNNKPPFLVFEHLHNGSLDHHIFGKEKEEALPWEIRIKIAIGLAQALVFLHSIKNGVLHQELRMYNILLDEQYNVKLFYLESIKEWPADKKFMGKFQYLAPEFQCTGHLGTKSDVYTFGVILLELLIGSESKVKKMQSLLLPDNYKIEEIIDPRLGNDYPKKAATQMGTLINRCTEDHMKKRPSMKHVLDALNDIAEIKD